MLQNHGTVIILVIGDSKEESILGGETVLTGKSPPHQFPVEHSIKNSLPVKRTAYRQGEKYEIRPIEKMVNNPFNNTERLDNSPCFRKSLSSIKLIIYIHISCCPVEISCKKRFTERRHPVQNEYFLMGIVH